MGNIKSIILDLEEEIRDLRMSLAMLRVLSRKRKTKKREGQIKNVLQRLSKRGMTYFYG